MNFLTFIIKNLLRRKARSVLTACGIALAVATLITLLGVADDFQNAILQSFQNEGSDIVISPKGELLQVAGDLPESHGPAIAAVPGVTAVSQGLIEQLAMEIDGDQVPVLLQGWRHGSFSFDDLDVVEGRMIEPDEDHVTLLGALLAEKMHAGVGDTVEFQEEPFKVVGIFESPTRLKRGSAVMLLHQLQDLMVREGSVTGFSVQVAADIKSEPGGVDRVADAIDILADEDGASLGLEATPTEAFVRNSFQLKATRAMAWFTSIIAVGVGSFGMLNTMIMSVMERIREISVLRAMGWRRQRVVLMIVGESVLLSVTGAAIGTGVAFAVSRAMAQMPQVNGFLSGHIAPWVVLCGLAIALLVGLCGAAYPAWRASRLLPSEGLRYE